MRTLLEHTTAYRLLRRDAESGKLSHTYLLLFADEPNLRFALKEFAKLFFDGSPRTNARIERENHIDALVYPEEGKAIDVECAERIIEESYLSPAEGDRKLFVLSDLHKAGAVAQNKLLKVLEEPPEGVYFLLGAAAEYPVLPTVKSRAKKLEIPPFSVESVRACLGRMYPNRPEEELYACAAASGGAVGKAQKLLSGGHYRELLDKAYACVAAEGEEIVVATRALQSVTEKKEFAALVTSLYRDMLFYRLGRADDALLRNLKGELEKLAAGFSAATLVYALDRMSEAEKEINFNANLAQCMEVGLLKIEKEKQRC